VRVYTNADLERLGPPSAGNQVRTGADDPGWEFVTEFLAREHARLDAERAWELARRRAVLEEEAALPPRIYGWSPHAFYGHPHGRSGRHPGRRSEKGMSSRAGLVVPLHARPSLALTARAKAIRRSGTEAVPVRARSSR